MQYEYSAYLATQDFKVQEAMFAKDKQKYLSQWRDKYEKFDTDLNFNQFEFIPNSSDALNNLPAFSFMLRVPFKLKKPYLSKDDRSFHLLDNPVRKDKVFKTPMVASTSWKGALRAALWQLNPEKYHKDDKQIIRLFGDASDDEKGQSGRLYFYPTFFDRIGLEVINPHNRKKGTSARGPIYLECVPQNATGELVILYVPFGKVEKKQVIEDLELVVKGVKEMLTVYGFGAKTSSGFGVVEQQGIGQIVINFSHTPQISPRPHEPEYPEKLRLFLEQYPDEDFQLKPDEWRKSHKASQSQRNSYRDAKNERSNYQNSLKTYESDLARWETEANAPPLPQISESFNTLDEMVLKGKEITENLCNGVQV